MPKKIYGFKNAAKKEKNWLKNKEDEQFYNSATWRKLSLSYKMGHPVCEMDDCTQPSYFTDHITPVSDGGDKLDESNLQALCKSCNAIKTVNQRKVKIFTR
jgi:5-methylcytosine-specific restriction protein A